MRIFFVILKHYAFVLLSPKKSIFHCNCSLYQWFLVVLGFQGSNPVNTLIWHNSLPTAYSPPDRTVSAWERARPAPVASSAQQGRARVGVTSMLIPPLAQLVSNTAQNCTQWAARNQCFRNWIEENEKIQEFYILKSFYSKVRKTRFFQSFFWGKIWSGRILSFWNVLFTNWMTFCLFGNVYNFVKIFEFCYF